MLLEYKTVMKIFGVGDTRHFHNRRAITAYFGYESKNNDFVKKALKFNPITINLAIKYR